MIQLNEYLINKTTKEKIIEPNEKVLVFEVRPLLDYGPMEPTVDYDSFVDTFENIHDHTISSSLYPPTKIDLNNLEEPLQKNENIIPDYEIIKQKKGDRHYLIFSNIKAKQLIDRELKTDKFYMYWNGAEVHYRGEHRCLKNIVIDYLKKRL